MRGLQDSLSSICDTKFITMLTKCITHKSFFIVLSLQATVHSHKQTYDYLQIERNMSVVAVFLLIMNPTEFRLVHSRNENCHYDHIPFNLKVISNIFLYLCVYVMLRHLSLVFRQRMKQTSSDLSVSERLASFSASRGIN